MRFEKKLYENALIEIMMIRIARSITTCTGNTAEMPGVTRTLFKNLQTHPDAIRHLSSGNSTQYSLLR